MRSSFSRNVYPPPKAGPFVQTSRSCRGNGATETPNSSLHGGRRLDPHRLKTFRLERGQYFLDMGAVAGLDRDIELGALGRHVEEQPVVIDFEDVDAKLAQSRRDMT